MLGFRDAHLRKSFLFELKQISGTFLVLMMSLATSTDRLVDLDNHRT